MNTPHEPFHRGEQALQQRVGLRERMAEVGPLVMRRYMPDPHRELFHKLPFVLVGSVDDGGRPQASLLAGPPGFLHTPDAATMLVSAQPHGDDPLASALRVGASLGLLGIEPHTRRRNRLNGVVRALRADGFVIDVRQSFGNCPKYIQARRAEWDDAAAGAMVAASSSSRLEATDIALVQAADTYFIASSVPRAQLESSNAYGVDVSHRGGKPGFVRIDEAADGQQTLTVPDFSGNNLFNTLGNLTLHPQAGLLFVDFERPRLLQLSVDTEIVWDGAELASFAGALRLLRYRVRGVHRMMGAPALRWGAAQPSPFVAATGSWARAVA